MMAHIACGASQATHAIECVEAGPIHAVGRKRLMERSVVLVIEVHSQTVWCGDCRRLGKIPRSVDLLKGKVRSIEDRSAKRVLRPTRLIKFAVENVQLAFEGHGGDVGEIAEDALAVAVDIPSDPGAGEER